MPAMRLPFCRAGQNAGLGLSRRKYRLAKARRRAGICPLRRMHNDQEKHPMNELKILENTFDADDFTALWNSVWDGAPTKEQVSLALANSIFRIGVYDGDKIVGMARHWASDDDASAAVYPQKRHFRIGYRRGALRDAGQNAVLRKIRLCRERSTADAAHVPRGVNHDTETDF